MIDRLRFLLDRPLDPLAARAIIVFASAILLGFAALFVLAAGELGRSATPDRQAVLTQSQAARSFGSARAEAAPSAPRAARRRRQDPQDEKGSLAAKRATRTLRSHRALQHVPYWRGHISVRLVGTRGSRAILAVGAQTISAAHRGWRRFLRRYRDSGRSYIPLWRTADGGGNG